MPEIQRTAESIRVFGQPRRVLDESDPTDLRTRATQYLRTKHGTQTLRAIQALALYELWACNGLFGSIGVGEGKTLLSLLAFTIGTRMLARPLRPMLLLPASLIDKTARESRILSQHWRLVPHYRPMSYEALGRATHRHILETDPESEAWKHGQAWRPDMIVMDECHRLKDVNAACTKRVDRWMRAYPETVCVALSGTITKDSLQDYWHIMRWCIGPHAMPLPNAWGELQQWSNVLDPPKEEAWFDAEGLFSARGGRAVDPGILWDALGVPIRERHGDEGRRNLRRAFGRFMSQTPGVIMTTRRYGGSLRINKLEVPRNSIVTEHMKLLRSEWTKPDGWQLFDAPLVRMAALEIICGFYYVWDPRPPAAWMDARKAYATACRDILRHNKRNLDSELMVANAIDAGYYPEAAPLLRAWRDVRDTFAINTKAVWFSDHMLRVCEKWMRENPRGVVWVAHTAFGEELARRNSIPFFGEGGLTADGRQNIETTTHDQIIASLQANKQGRNLQAWSRALVVEWPSNSLGLEQLLGRHHREGQKDHETHYTMIVACMEHVRAWERSYQNAQVAQDTTLQEQRILFADIVFDPKEFEGRTGPEWEKP